MNGKIMEGEFTGISIVDAIRSAEELGYINISKVKFYNANL